MSSKTFLTLLRKRLNISQSEFAALFNTKRNSITKFLSGSRGLTSAHLKVFDALNQDMWRQPARAEKTLSDPDPRTREKLRQYSDDLKISLRHTQVKLEKMQKNFQAELEAMVWLGIMKEAVLQSDNPEKRILLWIDATIATKQVELDKNNVSQQIIYSARISGIEAELRTIRNMLAKKKVVVKRMQVS
ncbi:MAG: helix-turn-helix transcriptional regulator [Flavobacteriales bacterium]|nr:helix-turn-helix transcriptional regulator [Flavobacteriales bacterium]